MRGPTITAWQRVGVVVKQQPGEGWAGEGVHVHRVDVSGRELRVSRPGVTEPCEAGRSAGGPPWPHVPHLSF